MKRLLKALTGIATLVVLLSQPTLAQDKEKDKEKDKDKAKSKNEQIIITRKSDKDTKVTIEIKGDEVLVNGKPADEYEDENIVIRKRHNVTVVSPRTPFRTNGGTYSFGGDNNHLFLDGNVAFLGVVTDEDDRGAKIEEVTEGSAADKAGLKKGDIITKVDDAKIESPDGLTKAVRKHKPEEKATITYLRDGKEQKATVTLGKRASAVFGNAYAPKIDVNPNFNFNWDELGQGYSYSFNGKGRLGVRAQDTEDGKGVKVLKIEDESAAEKAGLKEDDIITEFDGKTINSTDELASAARGSREKNSVQVKILRGGKAQTIEIKTPKKLKTTNL